MEKMAQKSCVDFIEVLASKAAVPGGGGAAALAGAIGMALGSMVCNLTTGKKKYAQYEEAIQEILDKAAKLFYPLSKAYGLPTSTEEEKQYKTETMEKCLKVACEVPMDIVRLCFDSIKLHEELVDKGSKLAISDVGCGVQCLRAAILSGQLNVIINVNSMKDREYAEKIEKECNQLVQEGVKICDEVYQKVLVALG